MINDRNSFVPQDQRKVRFGLVGCGHIGVTAEDKVHDWIDAHLWVPYSHAAAITSTDTAELSSVCDLKEAAAKKAKNRYRVPTWYLDYRQMIDCESLGGISIATRTAGRSDIIEYSVRKGIQAIYCEKPLSNSLETADYLQKLIVDNKVYFVYGTKRRFMPIYHQARNLIHAGEIGTLTTIIVRFGYSELFWTHPHSVDIASFFADDADVDFVQADLDLDPASVQGSCIDADPKVRMAHIRFKNGVGAYILASDSFDVELNGTKGSLCVRSNGRALHWRRACSETRDRGLLLSETVIPPIDSATGTANSFRALTRAVLVGESPGYDIGLAIRNQEVAFACVYSQLERGAKIRFPIERRNMTITGRSGALFA